jgi:hypothetical protein
MKILKLAIGAMLVGSALAGAASAQHPGRGPVEQGHVAYHYNQEAEPRTLVAVSGQNCDGTWYHDPLTLGQHIEYVYFDC